MISFAHKTSFYDTKMLLNVVFDKTAFVKFKISNTFKQNTDETQPKIYRKIYTSLWILKILRKNPEPKVSGLLPKVCEFKKRKPYPRVRI